MVVGSEVVVLVFGVAVCVLAAWGVYAPTNVLGLVKRVTDQTWGIYPAVIVRLLLGLVLIVAAPASRFPVAFQAIGWIAIVAAVALVIMGRERILRLVAWFERLSPLMIRLWLLFGIAFGGFLIYGVS